jgi:hypothetical protein
MQMKTDAITVTLGIFSGRPNPSLELFGNDAEQLAKLANAGFEGKTSGPPPAPKLGRFQGFNVVTPAALQMRLRLPAEFSVYAGVLTAKRNREVGHWQDAANLESFLLDQAQRAGHGELLARVGVGEAR